MTAGPGASPVRRALNSLAVLRCAGPDAVTFLQGQLTCDVSSLGDATGLAALATPQGRVIAVLRLRQRDDAVHALLPAAIAAAVCTRLRRYVLRARVEISMLDDWPAAWIEGDARLSGTPSAAIVFDIADGRQVLVAPGAGGVAEPAAEEQWAAADIAAGLPVVAPSTSEHFIPQMLNLDLLGAISFTKGCYTGQEIVARTQNLGRIKRRMFRYELRAGEPPAPLTGLHHDGTKVGEVLASARTRDGVELLAVVALEARDRPLRTADGHTAVPLPLPYAV